MNNNITDKIPAIVWTFGKYFWKKFMAFFKCLLSSELASSGKGSVIRMITDKFSHSEEQLSPVYCSGVTQLL